MHHSKKQAAFSFIEVMASAGLVALFLVGAFTANARGLSMIRAAKETNGASKILQQRMEQLRTLTWTDVTDEASLRELYATGAEAWESCNKLTEKVTIAPWPTGTGTIQITRAANGSTTLVSDNPALVELPTVLVTARVSWTGTGNRTRVRETCTVIANGGIGR